ncbi:hypothetical protein [Azohydromonas caseinilytica]|uniref:Uncharacterized protein n=1 Tax=Azohydromonas caseinilytica TaxID=2728836 RepID=A0A848FEG2_9BURK|nr:hypothetical protein [Azohydromonas caseinilytica]NML17798.1 hypothetical protein [Azohydromonas caseinilytica]
MNILKFSLPTRFALAGSLFSMAVMLSACGGGADDDTGAAAEASLAVTETAQAVAPATGGDAAAESLMAGRAAVDAWETEYDAATAQAFLASQQPQATTESAMAVRELATDARVKWNPGHYIASGKRDPQTLAKILAEIKPFPQVKGLLLRYDWAQLETDKGVYDFTKIDRDLGLVAAQGKRLFVMVGTKAFNAGGRAVPAYMYTPEYQGGAYKILIAARTALGANARYGENAALHNAKVRDRLIALTAALGARYNKHNAFEGITFNETAMGQMAVPLTSEQRSTFFSNLAQVDAATKQAFPNTVVMQFINFPVTYMPGLITSMVNNKVALGGPDILLEDRDLNNNVFPLYDLAKGKVPVGPSVQPENYLTTTQNGVHNPPAISALYNFGRTRLNANYLFWTRSLTGTPTPWPRVQEFFKSTGFPKDATGGLVSTCPTTYTSCVSKL